MDSKRWGVAVLISVASAFSPDVDASALAGSRTQAAIADLSVSITDGRAALEGPGDETTYTITLRNAGPAPAFATVLEGVLPRGLSSAVWGCLPQEEVDCAVKGSGDLSDVVNLPAGSTVTYLLVATLDEAAGNSVSNLVRVTAPAAVVDPTPADNAAVDVNWVGAIPSLFATDTTVSLRSGGPQAATVRVELASPLAHDVTVDFSTADGSATSPADYTARRGSVTFAAGVTSRVIEVEVLPSAEGGADRGFRVDFEVAASEAPVAAWAEVTLTWPRGFYTVAPCRLVDTRTDGSGAEGVPALGPGANRRFLASGSCGIPATATAVAANVTVAGPTAPGDLRVFAAGTRTPDASTLNYAAGQTRAAMAVVALSAEGEIEATSSQATGTADLVLDVTGYFK